MKTRPIGERFQDGDVTLEVKKEVCEYCTGCYYDTGETCVVNGDVAGECASWLRSDKKSVIFEKVEP
jgi:hypothetical protein